MVRFTKSPTGAPYFLAYNIGDEAELEPALEKELCDQGVAIPLATNAKEKATSKAAEKAEKR